MRYQFIQTCDPFGTGLVGTYLLYLMQRVSSRLRESNPRPSLYESDALPTELRRPVLESIIINILKSKYLECFSTQTISHCHGNAVPCSDLRIRESNFTGRHHIEPSKDLAIELIESQ